jgi:hypothetical protein
MARDFIKIDRSNPNVAIGAQQLKIYVQQLRNAYDSGRQVLAIMTHMNDGTSFADVETYFGLEAGKGQQVFDLINGSVGSMEGKFQVSDAVTITEQVG